MPLPHHTCVKVAGGTLFMDMMGHTWASDNVLWKTIPTCLKYVFG